MQLPIRDFTDDWSDLLNRRSRAPIMADEGFVCLVFDTFLMDNCGTKKECVGRTCQGGWLHADHGLSG